MSFAPQQIMRSVLIAVLLVSIGATAVAQEKKEYTFEPQQRINACSSEFHGAGAPSVMTGHVVSKDGSKAWQVF